jgi:hypothetical protein
MPFTGALTGQVDFPRQLTRQLSPRPRGTSDLRVANCIAP